MEQQTISKQNGKGNITRLYQFAFLFLGTLNFFMLYTCGNQKELSQSEFWFEYMTIIEGHSDVGDFMIVTNLRSW